MPPPDGEGVEGTLNNALNESGGSDNTMEISENYGNNVSPTKQPDNDQPKKMFNIFSDKYNIKFIYVMIESTESENFGRIHPLKVGHILHKKLFLKNFIEIKSMGKNRVRVQLHSLKDANDLLNNSALKAEKLRAFIPNHILESKGIKRGVDTFFSEEYISTNIKSSSRLISVKRMEKNVTDKDGQSIKVKKQMVLLTFEGNLLPNDVKNSVSFPVERFYGRAAQCFKCLKFGHISKQCRAKDSLCISCGQMVIENTVHNCDTADVFCIHCQVRNSHKSVSPKCPYFKKQQKIRTIMVDNNITFTEAEKLCENSFATVTTSNRFNNLENLSDYHTNFPPLSNKFTKSSLSQPNPSQRRSLPANILSHSQPSTSSCTNINKKRKIIILNSPEPMFPFTFGPSTPLAANTLSNQDILEKEKNNLINSISGYVISLLGKIKTIEDIKNIKLDSLKKEMVELIMMMATVVHHSYHLYEYCTTVALIMNDKWCPRKKQVHFVQRFERG
ncbi:unnamed protein product [Ceutorhynchus assimilis]|uniref:CCHC-type domain-containing protein n=1 Tax=Ceutorhynchus assimilis TaxID=467358 RepID=A0A9N9QKM2_9CUCU|nr:unnamed protein product [Ceutorhynchus assimilis]